MNLLGYLIFLNILLFSMPGLTIICQKDKVDVSGTCIGVGDVVYHPSTAYGEHRQFAEDGVKVTSIDQKNRILVAFLEGDKKEFTFKFDDIYVKQGCLIKDKEKVCIGDTVHAADFRRVNNDLPAAAGESGGKVYAINQSKKQMMVLSNFNKKRNDTYNIESVATKKGCVQNGKEKICVGDIVYTNKTEKLVIANSSSGAKVIAINENLGEVFVRSNYNGSWGEFKKGDLSLTYSDGTVTPLAPLSIIK